MSDVLDQRFGPPKITSPLTRFIVAVFSKSPKERLTADPQKAADGYGLPIEQTTYWINHARHCDEQWPVKRGGMK